tara:strand:- start:10381 stop:10812 length:432 start_codon:yes stop_codon:yes gene_type:complete
VKLLPLLGTFLIITPTLASNTPCDFKTKEELKFQGKVESVRINDKNVFNHVEDTRKCVISLSARIKKEWYTDHASYVFGPDVSQRHACELAEQRALKKIMQINTPQTLTSQKNLKCDLTKPKVSCKVIYMNTSIGKVKMETCE